MKRSVIRAATHVALGLLLSGTLISTAEAEPPAWGQKMAAAKRFKLVLDDVAVLDKETNVVWEQSPSTSALAWLDAQFLCIDRIVGGRKGWRLPTIQELMSLMDPNNPSGNPDLPPGHPFSQVQTSNDYWV